MFSRKIWHKKRMTKYTLSASAKRTKVILKETNVKWERRIADRKVRKRVAWSAFMDPEKNIPRQPAQKHLHAKYDPKPKKTSYFVRRKAILYQTPSTCCCRYRCPWLGQSLDLIWNHGTWLNSTYIVLLRGKGFPGVNSSPNSGKHPLLSPSPPAPAITIWRVIRARFLPPQAKLSSPNANSHFQLAPKHRHGDPKKIIGIHCEDSCLAVWKFESDRGVPRFFSYPDGTQRVT